MEETLKEKILKLRNEKLTYDEIKNRLGCSKSTISFHCRKENLDNSNYTTKISDDVIEQIREHYNELQSTRKVAKILKISRFTIMKYVEVKKEKLTESEKKANDVKNVIDWRRRVKGKLVEYKGGECIKCGYKKCIEALEFHHEDPKEKDFTISGKSWSLEKLKKEVDKCILVCSNCHKEIHYELKKKLEI